MYTDDFQIWGKEKDPKEVRYHAMDTMIAHRVKSHRI